MEIGKKLGFETADVLLWEILKANSKVNRHNPTPAENILWQLLRNNSTGHKIRRQHAIDGYIADFVCLGKGLVIEVDGDYHLYTQEQDQLRTAILNEKGFDVIRFSNNDVITKPQSVFINIKAKLDAQPNRTLT
ncbi:endonuclease domain-containing protein [Mucilaginibacter flavus]|uniref:endonuclease domain-containing protein n=1 Tax=Mucilaginibacter flavus TaxID=931504 RepID=UPI0025B4915E|nr:endonuclease domain-containing protein [Mucilaginibacter flavus]MDN3581193.1 endonuclease domain-containing protein [Mucilaginibacter flavus]